MAARILDGTAVGRQIREDLAPRIAVLAVIEIGHVMLAEAGLSFLGVGVQRKRRRRGLREDGHLPGLDLDLARGQLRVDVARLAPHDVPGDADDVFAAQLLGGGEQLGAVLRMKDELDDPGAVAQVDEDQAAVVTAVVDPARDARLGAGACGVEVAGPAVAVRVGARRRQRPRRGSRPPGSAGRPGRPRRSAHRC